MSVHSEARYPTRHPATRVGASIGAAPLERTMAIIGTCIVLVISMHALNILAGGSLSNGMVERASPRGNPVYLLLFAAQFGIFAVLLLISVLRSGVDRALAAAATACLIVTGSTLWSVGPSTTLFNGFAMSTLVIAAYVMAVYIPLNLFLRIFFYVGAAILFASFALLAVAPEMTGHPRYGGGWIVDIEFQGIMGSKNYAGMMFVAMGVLALHGKLIGIGGFLRLVVGLMSVVAVVLSNSATALVTLLMLAGGTIGLRLLGPGRDRVYFIVQLILVAAIFLLPFVNFGDVTEAVGREATLTGRTGIWEEGFAAFAQRPLLGHGYYGFYDTGAYSPVWKMWENSLYFFAGHFHNSAVDIAVSLGILGVLMLASVCFMATTILLRPQIGEAEKLLSMMLLSTYLISSSMELAIIHHNHVATLLTFYLAFVAIRSGSFRRASDFRF